MKSKLNTHDCNASSVAYYLQVIMIVIYFTIYLFLYCAGAQRDFNNFFYDLKIEFQSFLQIFMYDTKICIFEDISRWIPLSNFQWCKIFADFSFETLRDV